MSTLCTLRRPVSDVSDGRKHLASPQAVNPSTGSLHLPTSKKIKKRLRRKRGRTPIQPSDAKDVEAYLRKQVPRAELGNDKISRGISLPDLRSYARVKVDKDDKDGHSAQKPSGDTMYDFYSYITTSHTRYVENTARVLRSPHRATDGNGPKSDSRDPWYSRPGVLYDAIPVSRESAYEELPSDLPGKAALEPTQTPVTDQMFADICEDMACGELWKRIGHLMFDNFITENIDADHKRSREKAYQLLVRWKQRYGSGATVERLADIFRKAERTDLAEKLESLSKKERVNKGQRQFVKAEWAEWEREHRELKVMVEGLSLNLRQQQRKYESLVQRMQRVEEVINSESEDSRSTQSQDELEHGAEPVLPVGKVKQLPPHRVYNENVLEPVKPLSDSHSAPKAVNPNIPTAEAVDQRVHKTAHVYENLHESTSASDRPRRLDNVQNEDVKAKSMENVYGESVLHGSSNTYSNLTQWLKDTSGDKVAVMV